MSIVFTEWQPDPMILAASIDAVNAGLLDRSVPMAVAGEQLQASIRQNFETETAPDGTPWDDWAESYAPIAEAYPNEGILKQSTELMDAASRADAVLVTNDTVFYQVDLLPHYGLEHETGRPDRHPPLPARPFIGLTDQAQAVIEGAFWEWFDGNIDLFPTARGRLGMRHTIRGTGGRFATRASVGLGPL